MPVALLTLHGYGTWDPDRPQGYWHHSNGWRPPDADTAARYREARTGNVVTFGAPLQRFIIEASLAAATFQRLVPYCLPRPRRTSIRSSVGATSAARNWSARS